MKLEGNLNKKAIIYPLRFGMVQGRLIKSPMNLLQWFPQPYWEADFMIAGSLGFDYIELLAEREHNPMNPIWSEEGVERLKKVVDLANLTLPVFCNDYVIDNSLINNKECLEQNLELIKRGSIIGCEKFLLPLFEKSEITLANAHSFVSSIRTIADYCMTSGIELCLETLLRGEELIEVLEIIERPSISLVYDTGNRVAFDHDLAGDIRLLGKRISHMHIKDKNSKNENVILGTGLVNFKEVFDALAEIKYDGLYTFETNRGKNPARTATHNKQFTTFFYQESFLKK